jgi:DNA-binding response OmpR family regulator
MNRILLVDDESDVCFVLEKVLIEYGYVVDSYEHPLLALEKFKAHSYDLVILDINMPELNGFALYLEIKRLSKLSLPLQKSLCRPSGSKPKGF